MKISVSFSVALVHFFKNVKLSASCVVADKSQQAGCLCFPSKKTMFGESLFICRRPTLQIFHQSHEWNFNHKMPVFAFCAVECGKIFGLRRWGWAFYHALELKILALQPRFQDCFSWWGVERSHASRNSAVPLAFLPDFLLNSRTEAIASAWKQFSMSFVARN